MREQNTSDLDAVIWGAVQIGREAGVLKDDGSVDVRRTFYLLQRGLLDADKFGQRYATTKRRIRNQFAGAKTNAA
jgi:hypothetical protein